MCAAPAKDFRVELAYEKVNSLIGKVIPVDTIKSIVTSLEMKIVDETAEGLTLGCSSLPCGRAARLRCNRGYPAYLRI